MNKCPLCGQQSSFQCLGQSRARIDGNDAILEIMHTDVSNATLLTCSSCAHCADRQIFTGAKKHMVAASFSTLRIPYAQEFPPETLQKLDKILTGVGFQVFALPGHMVVLSRNAPTVKVWNNKGKAHIFMRLQGKDEFWSLEVLPGRDVQSLVDRIKTAGVHLVRYLALQQPITSAKEFSRCLKQGFKKQHMPHPEIVEPTQFAVLKQQFEFGIILQNRVNSEGEKFLAGDPISADAFMMLLGHYGLGTFLPSRLKRHMECSITTIQSDGQYDLDGDLVLLKTVSAELREMARRLAAAIQDPYSVKP